MNTKKLLPLISTIFSAAIASVASAVEIPATAIYRSAAPADGSAAFKSATTAINKANVGTTDGNRWKTFIVFDAVSAVEALAQNPEGSVSITVSWIKDPSAVQDLQIFYVGAFPSAKLDNDWMWQNYPKKSELATTIPAHTLAGLKKGTSFEFELKDLIPSGEVTPVNRYLIFRAQSDSPEDASLNGMIGLSIQLDQHILTVGASEDESTGATGGY